MATTVIYYLGYALIILTTVISAHGAWRRREVQRLDILMLLALVVLKPFEHSLGALGIAAALAYPYALLRLVHHFRDVRLWLRTSALCAIPAGALLFAIWRSPNHDVLFSVFWVYAVPMQ